MMRDRRALIALGLVALVAGVALLQAGQASFAAATGFSGRNGFTCISCHLPPETPVPEATIAVDGVPETWDPDTSYALTVRVEGGPPAVPAIAPQGGFEIAASAGRFAIPPDMEGLLRQPGPDSVTYTPEGTLMRTWAVEWTAPAAVEPPEPVTFWAAGVAANGNHNIQLNTSDGGETGDRTASIVLDAPADPDVVAAWEALPLVAPRIDAATVVADAYVVRGGHGDGNATHIAYRTDGDWTRQEAIGAWTLEFPDPPETLEVRSEGAGRVSPPVTVVEPTTDEGLPPVGTVPVLVALLFMGWMLRRP